MGYVFENLVQRFSESYNEEAGAHFTSRDIIYLMCDLLTTNADFSEEDAPAKTVYDMPSPTISKFMNAVFSHQFLKILHRLHILKT